MMIFFILASVLVIAGCNIFFRWYWDKELEVSLKFKEKSVYEGDVTQIQEKIENRKWLPLPVLELSFRMPKELGFSDSGEKAVVSDYVYKRDIFSLLGKQWISRVIDVECKKRGFYSVGEVSMMTQSLFFDRYDRKKQKVDTSIYVYAKRTDVSDIVSACRRMMGQVQCAKDRWEDPFAFAGIRQYSMTDPMRSINWKASAKTGELMVNTYESTHSEKVMIYLDVEDEGVVKQEKIIEDGIRVAATLFSRFLSQGVETGIAVNVRKDGEKLPVYLEPSVGNGQLDKAEKILAGLSKTDTVVEYEQILTPLEEDVVYVFISRQAHRNDKPITAFLGENRMGVWVLTGMEKTAQLPKVPSNLMIVGRKVDV